MADAKTVVGVLLLVVSLSAVYVSMQGVRIRADADKGTFYVKEGGRWVVSGEERVKLFNGSTQLSRNVTGVVIDSVIDNVNKTVTITRTTPYTRGPVIKETYFFDGAVDDVEKFPVSHSVEVFNASGMLLRYEASRLTYSGATYKLGGETLLYFGKGMNLRLEPGYIWAWVYASGTVRAQYGIGSDHEAYGFRLYDPATVVTLYLNGTAANATAEIGEPVNITAVSNNTGLLVCLSINHTSLGENFTCGATRVEYTWNPTASLGKFNDSSASKIVNYSLLANQTVYFRLHSYDRITNATLNLTGMNTTAAGNYPSNVKIYINDTLSNSIAGTLKEGVTSQDTFNDSSTTKNVSFSSAGSQTIYLSLPKNAIVTDAKLNLSGFVNYDSGYLSAYLKNFKNISQTITGAYSQSNVINWLNVSTLATIYGTADASFNNTVIFNLSISSTGNISIKHSHLEMGNHPAGGVYDRKIQVYNYTSGGWDLKNETATTNYTDYYYSDSQLYCTVFQSNITITNDYISGDTVRIRFERNFTDVNIYAGSELQGVVNCDGVSIGPGTNEAYINFKVWGYSNPTSPYLDVEGDGDMEWNWTVSKFNTTNTTANFSTSLNHYLGLCAQDVYGSCAIPMMVGSSSLGIIELSAVNVTYTASFNPVILNRTYLQNFLDRSAYGYRDVPIRIEASQGNVSVGNLSVVYNGSAVFNVTAFWQGNATHPAASAKLNLTTHYSNFTAAFPLSFMTEPVFLPLSNNSRNVSAYGQTASTPEYNITGKNYGQAMNLSIRLNQSMDSCMNMTVGINNTVYNFTLNATRRTILSNITVNQSAGLWLKLNLYNCNSSTAYRNWWVELESCCYRCLKCWG